MSSNDLESQHDVTVAAKMPLAFYLFEIRDDSDAVLPADTRLMDSEESQPPAQPSKRPIASRIRRFYRRSVVDRWTFESTCLVISIACLVIISTMLCTHDGKPLLKWSINISMNAFISILSGLAKSTLILATIEGIDQLKWSWYKDNSHKLSDFELFHLATRGSRGPAVFLIRMKSV